MRLFQFIVYFLQYMLVRLSMAFYTLVPASKAYSLGFRFAALIYPLFKMRHRIAIDNILKAKITADSTEAARIARHSFCHFIGHLLEALKVPQVINEKNWKEHIVYDVKDVENWNMLMVNLDIPVMLLTGHLGSWEAAVTIVPFTRPMMPVARAIDNPMLVRFLAKNHFRGNVTIISKKNGFTGDTLRAWKSTKSALTIVMDQHAGNEGIKVDFLGRPASTHTSPARIRLVSGAPIIVGAFLREGLFKYRMIGEPPIQFTPTGNKEKDIETLLIEMNQRLGNLIRKYPEQYLWMHKRWR
ncbi:MAG: lysophospholipid acyltransferase family protein [bacterium]